MTISQDFDASVSASVKGICESDIVLEDWSERHPISFSELEWSEKKFSKFLSNQVFPNFLWSDTIMQMLEARLLRKDYGEVGMSFFDSWRECGLEDRPFEEGDRYELQAWLMHLACSWMSSISKHERGQSSYECRSGVESMVELAFDLREGADQFWQPDAELALPDEPESVIADCAASMKLPPYWSHDFARITPFYPLSWSYSNRTESIITFVFVAAEDDSEDGENTVRERLQMCFYSAQKHRRACCCKDGPVFGLTLHDGQLQFYVSIWTRDTLVIWPIASLFALEFFNDFIECYFVLCRIAEFASDFLKEQFKQWDADERAFHRRVQEACKHPWRNKTPDQYELGLYGATVLEEGVATDVRLDTSKMWHVKDRYVRIVLDSVFRSPYSPETGYRLKRNNKKVFDMIMDAEKGAKQQHPAQDPAVWARETFKFRHEYEDPAPYFIEDNACEDACQVAFAHDHPRIVPSNILDQVASCDEQPSRTTDNGYGLRPSEETDVFLTDKRLSDKCNSEGHLTKIKDNHISSGPAMLCRDFDSDLSVPLADSAAIRVF